MKVGVLGSGDIAKILASGFVKHGHQVSIGTRTPAKLSDWTAQNPVGSVASFAGAADFGEIVVLAVKAVLPCRPSMRAGTEILADKIIIDATNRWPTRAPYQWRLQYFTALDESLNWSVFSGGSHVLGSQGLQLGRQSIDGESKA